MDKLVKPRAPRETATAATHADGAPTLTAPARELAPSAFEGSGPRARPPSSAALHTSTAELSTSGSRPAVLLDPAMESSQPRRRQHTNSALRAPPPRAPSGKRLWVVASIVVLCGLGAAFALRPAVSRDGTQAVAGVAALWGGVWSDPIPAAYATRVAARLAPAAHLEVFVSKTEVPQLLVLPGHQVLVTAGLLRRLANESMLAGLLAHAIAHIDRGDVARTIGGAASDAAQASANAMAPSDDSSEAALDDAMIAMLAAADYPSAGFADAYALLSAGPAKTQFALAHPCSTERLAAVRAAVPSGHSGATDYARFVLDVIGRSDGAAAQQHVALKPTPNVSLGPARERVQKPRVSSAP